MMSRFDPGGQVQRKLPNVFKQLPFLHGVILHSSTSVVKEKKPVYIHVYIQKKNRKEQRCSRQSKIKNAELDKF